MTSWLDDFWFPHTVTVRDGRRGAGAPYGEPRTLAAEVKDEQTLVRQADGEEVVSSTTVTVPLTAAVQSGALVTVWPGTPSQRESKVLTVARQENPPPLPSHLVLSLV